MSKGAREGRVSTPISTIAGSRISRTAKDRRFKLKLDLLAALLPQLARATGPLNEIVLHERRGKLFRILAIANGHISGRAVGGPMGHIFFDGQKVVNPKQALFNHPGVTADKKKLRCSLIPVQDEGELIGLLCVNVLIHDLQNAAEALAALISHEPATQEIQEFVPSHGDILDGTLDQLLRQRGRPADALTKQEKLDLLRTLRVRGVLNVRGATGRLAGRLGVSRTAVYNYLKEL